MSQLRTNSIVPVGGIPAGASGGGIVQMVKTSSNSQFSTASSTFQDVISASITPRSTSSKILVIASAPVLAQGNSEVHTIVQRGTTTICGPSKNSGTSIWSGFTIVVLDSPATTSSTTYKIQFKSHNAANTIYMGTGSPSDGIETVNITLLEISG